MSNIRTPSLGVCYYPEQWATEKWPIDFDQMRDLGIRFVRIAEFAWSLLEPSPGEYRFEWLKAVLDLAAGRELSIVLCTPTPTPPKWLVDQMPDMLPVAANGSTRKFGSRRHYCFSDKGYRKECERIVTQIAQAFGAHPAVAAWQTDNEYGCHDTGAELLGRSTSRVPRLAEIQIRFDRRTESSVGECLLEHEVSRLRRNRTPESDSHRPEPNTRTRFQAVFLRSSKRVQSTAS